MYTLRVLGGFTLLGPSGAPIPSLSHRRAEALLAMLAASHPQGCSRDRLIALLWPEADRERGRHSLRAVLHALRQTLGADVIVAGSGDNLLLNPSLVTSDVQRFVTALAATPQADAVAAYGGPFLDGFHLDDAPEFERWVDGERARFFRQCEEAIEELAGAAERAGRWRDAARWWGRAVELDPYNTRVVVRRMWALTHTGDRANALKEADAHLQRLKSELELEPEPAFRAEVERVKRGELGQPRYTTPADIPVRQPAAPPGAQEPGEPTASARRGRSPLRIAAGAVALLAVVAVAAALLWLRAGAAPLALDERKVAVLPTSAPDDDPDLRRLAAALGPFLADELGAGPPLRAAPRERVRAAWTAANAGNAATDWSAAVTAVARASGAGLRLVTSLARSNGGIRVTARLERAADGAVRSERHLNVAPESLEAAARVLLLEVEAEHLGQPQHRITWLARRAPGAARVFLEGPGHPLVLNVDCPEGWPWEQCAGPYGNPSCREWVGRVLEQDSGLVQAIVPCFYTAGVWPYIGRPSWRDTLSRWAWERRAGLPQQDRAFVEALIGPMRGLAPDLSQRVALWQRAAYLSPDWWMPWEKLAEAAWTYGPMAFGGEGLARNAFNTAVGLCDTNCTDPVTLGFWFHLLTGDTLRARRLADAAQRRGMRGWWGYWKTEYWPQALAMARATRRVDRSWAEDVAYDIGENGQPVRVAMATALALPLGAPAADLAAERYQEQATRRGLGTVLLDTWLPPYWRARGYYRRWIETRLRTYVAPAGPAGYLYNDVMVVQEAAYLGAPEDSLLRGALGRLTRIVRGDTAVSPGVLGVAHCWLSHWRLGRGDTSGVRSAIAYLREMDRRDRTGLLGELPDRHRWDVCPATLEARLAQLTGRGAREAARSLDALLRPLPLPRYGYADANDWFPTHDFSRMVENLLAARLLAAAGDTAAALLASRRRPRDIQWMDFFPFMPEYLREEGRLAAAMADTVGATLAYRYYLALRVPNTDHAPWRAERDSVAAHLALLTHDR